MAELKSATQLTPIKVLDYVLMADGEGEVFYTEFTAIVVINSSMASKTLSSSQTMGKISHIHRYRRHCPWSSEPHICDSLLYGDSNCSHTSSPAHFFFASESVIFTSQVP
jgi:hypothetical protein